MPKRKKNNRAARKKAQSELDDENTVENEEQPAPTDNIDNNGDIDMDWNALNDSDLEKSDDETPTTRKRRHKKAKIDDWAQEIIQDLVERKGEDVKAELHSEDPDFTKIEGIFGKANRKIQRANIQHGVSAERNMLPEKRYRQQFESWSEYTNSNITQGKPENGWKAYDAMHKVIGLINQEHGLPRDWNIPPDATIERFGERPESMGNPLEINDTESAASYSDESESEGSESDEPDGIGALESRMRTEYSALSSGKVLYWWRVGTGTQIFVRYGSKRKPIYRVRAGLSEPYDPQRTELVLSTTPGNSKSEVQNNGVTQEVWKHGRNDVSDIIGVGWKIEDDDEANMNALALIRPKRYASYPHTRVLVKWKNGNTSLERRGFIRRIANGNSFNGDRMIYLKAKELENAYWGYDVEEDWDQGSDERDDSLLYKLPNRRPRTSHGKRPSRPGRGVRFAESEEESDADSEASESSIDNTQTRRRRQGHSGAKKSNPFIKRTDHEAEVNSLIEEINRLRVKQKGRNRGGQPVSQSRRWKTYS